VKHIDRANALTPGDWSSLRDVIRDLAAEVDALKISVGTGRGTSTGDAAASGDGAPDQNHGQ